MSRSPHHNFDEIYYEHGLEAGVSLYTSYRWMPERTLALSHHLVLELGISPKDKILDFGTAKGFLPHALRILGYDAYGLDTSDYALSKAPDEIKPYISSRFSGIEYDWIIAKDVFEHMRQEELRNLLKNEIRLHGKNLFAVVPLGDGAKYNAPEYERDATHVIRQGVDWWMSMFEHSGFDVRWVSTNMPKIKQARCPNSDGFFILERR